MAVRSSGLGCGRVRWIGLGCDRVRWSGLGALQCMSQWVGVDLASIDRTDSNTYNMRMASPGRQVIRSPVAQVLSESLNSVAQVVRVTKSPLPTWPRRSKGALETQVRSPHSITSKRIDLDVRSV